MIFQKTDVLPRFEQGKILPEASIKDVAPTIAALLECATPTSFGPAILRAETAAIFAVAVAASRELGYFIHIRDIQYGGRGKISCRAQNESYKNA